MEKAKTKEVKKAKIKALIKDRTDKIERRVLIKK